MAVFPPGRDEIISRFIDSLTRLTGINQTVAGGKARTVGEAIGREIELVGQLEEANRDKGFLPTTYGQFLDYFASMVGISRRPARNAEVLAEDRVVKFYVIDGGTFGSINNDTLFVIPAGTILTAPLETSLEQIAMYSGVDEPDHIQDRSVHYTLTEDVYCQSTEKEAWASVKAMTAAARGNLATPNMLVSHSFTDYESYLRRPLRVTNTKPILNGISKEADASLKYRISKALTSAETANETAIGEAVLGVPGVADYAIIPFEDGIGRYNVYIKSISSTVSDKVLADVQARLDDLQAAGCVGYARRPFEIGMEIRSNLVYSQKYSEEEKVLIRENFAYATVSYINSLDVGQPLILSDLASDLLSVDSRVTAVGNSNETIFDSVFVYYPARLTTLGKRRERLIQGAVDVAATARIIVEPSISSPIVYV